MSHLSGEEHSKHQVQWQVQRFLSFLGDDVEFSQVRVQWSGGDKW